MDAPLSVFAPDSALSDQASLGARPQQSLILRSGIFIIVHGLVAPSLAACFAAALTGFGQLAITFVMNRFRTARHHICWRDITDRAVKAFVVVSGHEVGHHTAGFFHRQGRLRSNAFRLNRAMIGRIVSTSCSVMCSRISQWTTARLKPSITLVM